MSNKKLSIPFIVSILLLIFFFTYQPTSFITGAIWITLGILAASSLSCGVGFVILRSLEKEEAAFIKAMGLTKASYQRIFGEKI